MSILGPHGFNPDVTTATGKFDLLSRAANEKGEWRYGKASAAIEQYTPVKISNDGDITILTTAESASEPTGAGVTQIAFAVNEYGWVWVGCGGGAGSGIKVKALTLCQNAVKIYTTADASGAVDDTATDLIQGLSLISTNAAGGTVAMECYSPIFLTTNCL